MESRFAYVITFVLAVSFTVSVHAADWPTRHVRVIVPAAPGGGTDLLARVISDKLRDAFQQSFIVDNKPGAEELIAQEYVAKSAPDGYTIFFSASPIAVNPSLRRKLPFDPVRDFQPVAQLAVLPFVLAIHPKLAARTIPELVALSKKQPNGLNAAVGGTANMLVTELFRVNTGTTLNSVPYKGCGPATQAVLTGDTDLVFCSAPSVAPFVSSGKLVALAVTGDKRLSMLPNVPTTKELGSANYQLDLSQWIGVFVPANTPTDVVTRLNAEINRALAAPDIVSKIAAIGAEANPMSVDEATRFYHGELAKFRELVKRANISLQ